MTVIPAIDIIDGRCVRLRMGDYDQKTIYGEDPLAIARSFESAGLKRLHVVDLDGAREGHVVNLRVLERIASGTSLVVDAGGGLKSADDFSSVFSCGASMATVGSLAATDRGLTLELLDRWGAERLFLGADCRECQIAVSGWTRTVGLHVLDFIRDYLVAGFRTVVSTDVSRDGMLSGPALELYRSVVSMASQEGLPLELIASGGIRDIADLEALAVAGISGAIVGKALYEGRLNAEELAAWQMRMEG